MKLPVMNEYRLQVTFMGRTVHLTPHEYGILKTLLQKPGHLFTAEEIYREAWHAEPYDCHPVISVHIRHLREKLEADPSHPSFIKGLWGRGYLFTAGQ